MIAYAAGLGKRGAEMLERRIVFGAPNIGEEEIEEVVQTLRSGWIGTGPKVSQFEREFAEFKQVTDAVAVSSCTAALHLSLIAAGVGDGDEVITTPLTFCATANAIIHCGAKPVLVDVEPDTMNIDVNRLSAAITSRTRAIIPVHFAGRPCDMGAIASLAAHHNLKVVEDCAHAVEAEWHGHPTGTLGDFGCFSFYATKNITTCEGGMILARNPQDVARLKRLALHGMSKDAWKRFSDHNFQHYSVTEVGYKCNMTDLNASIGLHQMRRLVKGHERRQHIWEQYDEAFAGLPFVLPPPEEPGTKHARHLYTLLVDPKRCGITRSHLANELANRQIGTGIHYTCLAEHPVYQERFGWQPDDYPMATAIGRQTISLPLSAGLSDEDVNRIIMEVRKAALVGAVAA